MEPGLRQHDADVRERRLGEDAGDVTAGQRPLERDDVVERHDRRRQRRVDRHADRAGPSDDPAVAVERHERLVDRAVVAPVEHQDPPAPGGQPGDPQGEAVGVRGARARTATPAARSAGPARHRPRSRRPSAASSSPPGRPDRRSSPSPPARRGPPSPRCRRGTGRRSRARRRPGTCPAPPRRRTAGSHPASGASTAIGTPASRCRSAWPRRGPPTAGDRGGSAPVPVRGAGPAGRGRGRRQRAPVVLMTTGGTSLASVSRPARLVGGAPGTAAARPASASGVARVDGVGHRPSVGVDEERLGLREGVLRVSPASPTLMTTVRHVAEMSAPAAGRRRCW